MYCTKHYEKSWILQDKLIMTKKTLKILTGKFEKKTKTIETGTFLLIDQVAAVMFAKLSKVSDLRIFERFFINSRKQSTNMPFCLMQHRGAFAGLLSGGFISAIIVNPQESTSVK